MCRSSGVCIFHSNWRLWTIRNISSISNFITNYLILWLLIRSAITKIIYGNTKRWPETVYKFIYVLYPPNLSDDDIPSQQEIILLLQRYINKRNKNSHLVRNLVSTPNKDSAQLYNFVRFRWHCKSFESETDFKRETRIKLVNKISGAVENCQINLYFWTGIHEKFYVLQSKVF